MSRYGRCSSCKGWIPPQEDHCPHCGASVGLLGVFAGFFGRRDRGAETARTRPEDLDPRASRPEPRRPSLRIPSLLPAGWSTVDALIGVCVVAFLLPLAFLIGREYNLMKYLGGDDFLVLVKMGANWGLLLFAGEYWRLLTATFLHIGVLHLLFNMVSFRAIGPAVEELYGGPLLVAFWVLAGIGGNLLSWSFQGAGFANAGASGAIFGLIGVGIVHCWRNSWGNRAMLNHLLQWAGINLVLGFLIGADNYAHVGGLLTGGALAFVLPAHAVNGSGTRARIAGAVATLGILAAFALNAMAMRALPVH